MKEAAKNIDEYILGFPPETRALLDQLRETIRKVAPAPKMRYVVILGIIGTLLGIMGVFVNMKYDLAPMWYPILLVLLGFPSLYLGAKLRTR